MLILSVIIYVIFSFMAGPLWPLPLLGGKAGPLGYLLVICWFALFIAGLNS